VYAADFVATSDGILKNVEGTIENSLEKILQIRGVRYTWNELGHSAGMRGDTSQIGVLAEDVEQLFPELVGMTPDGYKAVRYDRLIPVLIEAIKELNAKVTKH